MTTQRFFHTIPTAANNAIDRCDQRADIELTTTQFASYTLGITLLTLLISRYSSKLVQLSQLF